MRCVCLLTFILPAMLIAQDGAAIYKERCASCHDAAEGRAPKLDALKTMTGEAIFTSLATGGMKKQAEGLSPQQLFALLGFIAPTGQTAIPGSERSCKGLSPVNNLRMVLLPQPLGPIRLTKESLFIERVISSRALTWLSPTVYVLDTLSSRKAVSLLCKFVKMAMLTRPCFNET